MSELTPETRDAYLASAPAREREAMRRIHYWADNSPNLRDKIAVDELFTFVAELMRRAELAGRDGDTTHA